MDTVELAAQVDGSLVTERRGALEDGVVTDPTGARGDSRKLSRRAAS
jgi:hypothetical protein